MTLTREKKKEIVGELDTIFGGAAALVFVRFRGLSVPDTTAMRRVLREKNIGLRVAKKTLLRRALVARGFAGDVPELDGEVGFAYATTDVLAPAREIYAFARKFKDALTILGGIMEGHYIGRAAALELATIPPRETLIAQIVQLINSPIQRLAVALGQIANSRES